MKETVEAAQTAEETATGKSRLPLIPLILAMCTAVLVALAAVGGAGYWLYTSGKLPGVAGLHAAAKAPMEPVKPLLAQVVLDPLLVNLADSDGRSYLRVAITLMVEQKPLPKGAKPKEEKPEKGKPVNEFEASERDALLSVLGRQTGERLLAPDGKDDLKMQIRTALRQRVPEVVVSDVLFTDFLVQR